MLKVTVLVGNPKPDSRTRRIAELLARRVAPDTDDLVVIDLARHTSELFVWPSDTMSELMQRVADSDVLLVASPTYKATYTGLLKSFLDRYPKDGLEGVTAIPIMTGSDLTHAMAPEVHMRTLLVELGAQVPTRALYFVTTNMNRTTSVIDEWLNDNLARIRAEGIGAVPPTKRELNPA